MNRDESSDRIWKQLALVSKKSVRQILCELASGGGEMMEFQRVYGNLKQTIPYSTANQLIKRLAESGIIELEGGPKTGWKIRVSRRFKIPSLNIDSICEMETGKPRMPSD